MAGAISLGPCGEWLPKEAVSRPFLTAAQSLATDQNCSALGSSLEKSFVLNSEQLETAGNPDEDPLNNPSEGPAKNAEAENSLTSEDFDLPSQLVLRLLRGLREDLFEKLRRNEEGLKRIEKKVQALNRRQEEQNRLENIQNEMREQTIRLRRLDRLFQSLQERLAPAQPENHEEAIEEALLHTAGSQIQLPASRPSVLDEQVSISNNSVSITKREASSGERNDAGDLNEPQLESSSSSALLPDPAAESSQTDQTESREKAPRQYKDDFDPSRLKTPIDGSGGMAGWSLPNSSVPLARENEAVPHKKAQPVLEPSAASAQSQKNMEGGFSRACPAYDYEDEFLKDHGDSLRLQMPAKGVISAGTWAYPSGQMHLGMDLALNMYTPIYAPTDGVIVYANAPVGDSGGYLGNWIGYPAGAGNSLCMIGITEDGLFGITFAHLSSNLYVRAGQQVRQGDLLAKSGNTGNSTGPHTHIELFRIKNSFEDVASYFSSTADFAFGCGWNAPATCSRYACRVRPEQYFSR